MKCGPRPPRHEHCPGQKNGAKSGQSAWRLTGDNCYMSLGAKLFGGIVIGDNVKIGANPVMNKSFPEGNCTLVGIPAHIVCKKE